MSYFTHQSSVNAWQVLNQSRCWVCERWKHVVAFFDRRLNENRKPLDVMTKMFIIRLNTFAGTWDIRRAAPVCKVQNPFALQSETKMCSLMKYCARVDPKL